MDKFLKIVVQLQAIDKMSSVISKATNQSIRDLDKLKHASNDAFGKGAKQLAAGAAISASLAPAVKAFSEFEDTSTRLKTLLMDQDGNVGKDFEKINKLAIQLGNKLPGTTADFQELFSVMLKNGMDAKNILNGVGSSAAYLAVNTNMPFDQVGEFAARLKLATGVADKDMLKFMDNLNRIDQVGIKANDMSYAFQRSAGTLKLFELQGIKATQQVSNLFAQLIRETGSGERVGTGFKNILSQMLDPKKYLKFKEAAAAAGVDLKMFDKGKFLGIENFVRQLDKLKGLSSGQKSNIANALTGGGGDAELFLILANQGLAGYNSMNSEMAKHASLQKQVGVQLTTLKQVWEATTGTITNMLAALGAGIAPELKKVANLFGRLAGKLQEFLSANPAFSKFITLAIAGVGVLLSVIGVINLLKGAFILLRVVMMANPFILIATVAIAAAAFIYAHWGKISAWFKKLWGKVVVVFKKAWSFIKTIFTYATPAGLIFKHWDKVVDFFGTVWARVKELFKRFVLWFVGLHVKFFNAGANIAKSIWKGIKMFAHKPIEAIQAIVQKIRDHLPFSPAKIGPLKDINKIRIVETIAETIRPKPLISAMRRATASFVLGGVNNDRKGHHSFAGIGSFGDGVTVHFNPTISGGDSQSIAQEMRRLVPELAQMIKRELNSSSRLSLS